MDELDSWATTSSRTQHKHKSYHQNDADGSRVSWIGIGVCVLILCFFWVASLLSSKILDNARLRDELRELESKVLMAEEIEKMVERVASEKVSAQEEILRTYSNRLLLLENKLRTVDRFERAGKHGESLLIIPHKN